MQSLFDIGVSREVCVVKVARFFIRLNVSERLWYLVLSIFFGGEQQRVNIVRGFIVDYFILLFDEFIVSLDVKNSVAVVELIREVKIRGVVIVGIFYDEVVRNDVVDRLYLMGVFL